MYIVNSKIKVWNGDKTFNEQRRPFAEYYNNKKATEIERSVAMRINVQNEQNKYWRIKIPQCNDFDVTFSGAVEVYKINLHLTHCENQIISLKEIRIAVCVCMCVCVCVENNIRKLSADTKWNRKKVNREYNIERQQKQHHYHQRQQQLHQ